MKKPKICYLVRDDGACGYYRMELPHKTLHLMGVAECVPLRVNEDPERVQKAIDGADIVVIARPVEEPFKVLLRVLRDRGQKSVVDFDDLVDSVHPLSNHYEEWGQDEVTVVTDTGEKIELWKDGQENFDLARNREIVKNHYELLGMADLVTCTQPILADEFRKYNPNVEVLPNCVDGHIWRQMPKLQQHEGIRMLWTGGSSHYWDILLLKDVLPVVAEKYPEVTFVVFGQMFSGIFKDIPQERVEYHEWVPTPAYPYAMKMLDVDFTLITLEDEKFNRCKSAIKWIEQSFLETPCVVSNVTPYKEYYNGNNMVMVENTKESWLSGIDFMIKNSALRRAIGMNALGTVEHAHDINIQYKQWEDVYARLLGG